MRHLRWTIALGLAVSGCSIPERTVDLKKLLGPYRVEDHAHGRLMQAQQVVPGSREELLIMKWFDDHSFGWRPDVITYAPAQRIVGEFFDANFVGGKCVLNYKAGRDEGWVQVSRPIRPLDAPPDVFAAGY